MPVFSRGASTRIRADRISGELRRRSKLYNQALAEAVEDAAEILLREALKIVPTDTSELYNSGEVVTYGQGTNKVSSSVQFTAEHALIVHEDVEARHGEEFNRFYAADIAAGKTHRRRPNEQAKFLEQPSRQYRSSIARHIASKVRAKMAKHQ